jgi:hypothetical protein
MVKVFKWYPVIDLFDTFTGKLGHGRKGGGLTGMKVLESKCYKRECLWLYKKWERYLVRKLYEWERIVKLYEWKRCEKE